MHWCMTKQTCCLAVWGPHVRYPANIGGKHYYLFMALGSPACDCDCDWRQCAGRRLGMWRYPGCWQRRRDGTCKAGNITWIYIDGLVQDCGNSSALALELPQSCTKPSINTVELLQSCIKLSVQGRIEDLCAISRFAKVCMSNYISWYSVGRNYLSMDWKNFLHTTPWWECTITVMWNWGLWSKCKLTNAYYCHPYFVIQICN